MTNETILITGASGFIGRNLCDFFLEKNPDQGIIALVRSHTDLPEEVCQIVVTDWTYDGLISVLKDQSFSMIYHLAAYGVAPHKRNISEIFTINTLLPAVLVELAKFFEASLISAGSSAEYSVVDNENLVSEENALTTDVLYGLSKASGWLAASASARALGVPYLHLRLFNVYGSGEAAHRLFPSLKRALLSSQKIPLSDGEQIRDFIHVSDVCKAFNVAGQFSRTFDGALALNVCTGLGHSVRQFADLTCEIIEADPTLLEFGKIARRPDDIPVLIGNPSLASDILGFEANVDLKSGLTLSVDLGLEAA